MVMLGANAAACGSLRVLEPSCKYGTLYRRLQQKSFSPSYLGIEGTVSCGRSAAQGSVHVHVAAIGQPAKRK